MFQNFFCFSHEKTEGKPPPFFMMCVIYQPVPSSTPCQRPSSLSWMVQQR